MSVEMAKLLRFAFLLAFAWKIHGLDLDNEKNSLAGLFTESKDEVSKERTGSSRERMESLEKSFHQNSQSKECLSDPDEGECHDKMPRWNYDSRKEKCYRFWYTGCGGNGNNFFSKKECETSCKTDGKPSTWSVELLDKAPSFNFCHGGGLQPYFRSCRKYVFCLNQIGYIFNCPPGLHFNAKSQKCVLPCAAFCDPDFACICKWKKCLPNDFTCPESNGKFTVPTNCSLYLQCTNSIPEIQECSIGKSFDVVKKICVPSNTAVCHDSDYEKLNSQEFACPERNGNFSVPMNCTKYIECKNFIPTSQECPKGKSFDSKTKTCVPWYEAVCDQSAQKDLNFPIQLKCPYSNGNFSVPTDCTKYINCKNFKSTPKECPRGKYFDSKKKICVPWYEAFCYPGQLAGTDSVRDHILCSQEGVFHYRQNCKKYIMCADKKLYMMHCPKDKSFDYIRKECVPDNEARCYS